MPWANSRGATIYWEEEGSGEPLILITGLGFCMAMWGDLRSFLAQRFRTILLDNRCSGRSDAPVAPFTIANMAADTVAVMDAAGVERAHVFGFSMGGMIAQELALRWPERVNRLVLGGTHSSGLRVVRADPELLRLLACPWTSRAGKITGMVRFLYHPETPVERVHRAAAIIHANPPRLWSYALQVSAIARWSSLNRLPAIQSPSLVMHGECDRLVLPDGARSLANRIPGARLAILPRAAHVFHTDQPELCRAELSSFLLSSE